MGSGRAFRHREIARMPGRSRRGGMALLMSGASCRDTGMRTAYRVRAYPDPEQAAVLNRTFGCVRVVWNRTLATRQARYATEHTSTSYRDTDAALTALKNPVGRACDLWLA